MYHKFYKMAPVNFLPGPVNHYKKQPRKIMGNNLSQQYNKKDQCKYQEITPDRIIKIYLVEELIHAAELFVKLQLRSHS